MTFVFIRFEENTPIADKYNRLKKRGFSHRKAIVACSNSMLQMVYIMIRDDRVFISDPEKLKNARSEAEKMSESEEE